tara:strand:- start:1913 stop:2233 length:321 start_codon:yes stop_codon:yes gene_type:complete
VLGDLEQVVVIADKLFVGIFEVDTELHIGHPISIHRIYTVCSRYDELKGDQSPRTKVPLSFNDERTDRRLIEVRRAVDNRVRLLADIRFFRRLIGVITRLLKRSKT